MSGTTTTDVSKALMIPFKNVFTVIELNGSGGIVIRTTPTGPMAFGASDVAEAAEMVKGWDATPLPAPTVEVVATDNGNGASKTGTTA